MPDASGLDLMRELRARGYMMPGIALGGCGQEQDIQRSREAGFAAHLTKPVTRNGRFHDLRHTFASLLLTAGAPIAYVSE